MVSATHNETISLASSYDGISSGVEVKAYFNTPPSTYFDLAHANSSEELRNHILLNFDNSPFNEDIITSKQSFSSVKGHGVSYHVTFTGPSFREEVDEFIIISSLKTLEICHAQNSK